MKRTRLKAKSTKQTQLEREQRIPRKRFREQMGHCVRCSLIHWSACDVHEIASGSHRRKAFQHREAWLCLCRGCHDVVQYWPLERQYAMKAKSDGEFYDRVFLNELRSRAPDSISELDVLREALKGWSR